MFSEQLVESFLYADDEFLDNWKEIADTAIRLHNKLDIPNNLDKDVEVYTKILRDVDKIDIIRGNTEEPFDKRNRNIVLKSKHGNPMVAKYEIIQCIHNHRCVPYELVNNEFESLISQCCLAFDLAFPYSKCIVKQQGYLRHLLNIQVEDKTMRDQLKILRYELREALTNEQYR